MSRAAAATSATAHAAAIMRAFAARTGLEGATRSELAAAASAAAASGSTGGAAVASSARRYLWTDSFAVATFLSLYKSITNEHGRK